MSRLTSGFRGSRSERMDTLPVIFLIPLFLYLYKILTYKRAWDHYPEFTAQHQSHTTISVVIAFRNEIMTLEGLLDALSRQTYPKELYDVILVNDHSDDGSEITARRYCKEISNFRLIENCGDRGGKKAALQLGLKQASNELIVVTDADCIMETGWLATFAAFYSEKKPDMILGLVDLNAEEGFFSKYRETEFLSLVASGAAAAAQMKPIYCNAACMAFTKALYNSIDDPLQQRAVSGDDTLFMHRVKREKGRTILLLKSLSARVITRAPESRKAYDNQRRRWVSKSAFYRDRTIIYTAVLVLLMNLWLVISAGMALFQMNYWIFPVLLLFKYMVDLLFLKDFYKFYGKKLKTVRFLMHSIMYPFYTVYVAVTGLILGYTWKGRYFRQGI
jgi:poly-beta-1,6-N-acetyl-D-glucosamine synthase